MDLGEEALLCVDEGSLVFDCDDAEAHPAENAVEDWEVVGYDCFLDGEADHQSDHPYTCGRVEDQDRVGPQPSWLDRVRPKRKSSAFLLYLKEMQVYAHRHADSRSITKPPIN